MFNLRLSKRKGWKNDTISGFEVGIME